MDWAAAALFLVALVMSALQAERWLSTPRELAGFGEAIDGDSLRVAGETVRLKGIDAPELAQWCENQAGRRVACGVEASRALRDQLRRGAVTCAVEGRDRYGRYLARCRAGRLDLNAWMVEQGRAVSWSDYPDEEQRARAGRRGLWAGTFQQPSDWRRDNPRAAGADAAGGIGAAAD